MRRKFRFSKPRLRAVPRAADEGILIEHAVAVVRRDPRFRVIALNLLAPEPLDVWIEGSLGFALFGFRDSARSRAPHRSAGLLILVVQLLSSSLLVGRIAWFDGRGNLQEIETLFEETDIRSAWMKAKGFQFSAPG